MGKSKILNDVRKIIIVLMSWLLLGGTFAFGSGNSAITETKQSQVITGTVVDQSGESVIGASVIYKGTTIGAVTDFDGNFSLSVPSLEGTIVVSYVGYQTQEIAIGNRKTLSITLKEDTELLDEVVVIGYGTVKKRDLTGAVSSMTSQDILAAPTTNVMEALSGKVAGMDIIKPSGKIGDDVEILLRGSRSIYGDNTPLFIIDGIPGSYNQINPSDIESIDVLKDASSTAIYGSAGANGVVIITTKRGKEGKSTINLDAYYGVSGKPDFFHGMIGDEWTNYQREAYKYKNGQYPADMSTLLPDANKLDAFKQNKWIDWVDEAAGNTATTERINLSITGGSEKTRVFSSISYSNDQGLLKNDNQDKYNVRLNIDQTVQPWLKAGLSSNVTFTNRNSGVKNTFTRALSAFPLGDAYDENGDLVHEYATSEYSPLGDFIRNQYANNTKNTFANINGSLEFLPTNNISFKTVISGTLNNNRLGQFWGAQANANRPTYAGTPHASITNSFGRGYTWENILSYSKTFNKVHDFGATFVTSWSHNQNESNMAAASGQQLEAWSFWRLMSGTSAHVESDFTQTQKMSYAMRFNYSFGGRYLVTFSNRWDGVSWLSPGHKWDSFPAGAVAWRVSDEEFMKNIDWLSNLKVRVGYGVTGNSGGVGAYGTSTNAYAYSSAGISINGNIVPFTQYSGTYGNPSLGWEKSHNWNYGLDLGFLNSKLNGTLDFFKTRTKGLLFKRTMPITSGITGWGSPLASWENIAETSNTGVEFTLNSHNIRTKDFTWDTNLSFTWSEEKIESLPSGDLIAESLFEGFPIHSIYDYKYLGIWGSNTPQDVLDSYGVKPGWVKVETIEKEGDNGVHKYSQGDRQIIGHTNPNFILGLNNSFTYKSLDFSAFFMGRFGQTIKSDLIGWYDAKATPSRNQPSGINYWTNENQDAYYPTPGSGDEQTVMSSLTYRDGSFIKIKNITLGYSLPSNLVNKTMIEKCRLYVTAYNPYLFVMDKQLKGTDPETNGSDAFPLYKQFVVGFNLTF